MSRYKAFRRKANAAQKGSATSQLATNGYYIWYSFGHICSSICWKIGQLPENKLFYYGILYTHLWERTILSVGGLFLKSVHSVWHIWIVILQRGYALFWLYLLQFRRIEIQSCDLLVTIEGNGNPYSGRFEGILGIVFHRDYVTRSWNDFEFLAWYSRQLMSSDYKVGQILLEMLHFHRRLKSLENRSNHCYCRTLICSGFWVGISPHPTDINRLSA